MNQLLRFLDVCKRHASTLTASQRQEMAIYLVPEVGKHHASTLNARGR
jgi:hypothetical protein